MSPFIPFPRSTKNRLRLIALAAAALSLIAFLPSLGHGFVNWDDPGYVYRNQNLDRPGLIPWAFVTFRQGNWHPLTWLSLGVDHAVWGLNPKGYHLTNILLHALNTCLVVLVTGALFEATGRTTPGGRLIAAALTGITFGLHPLHVESVAWVSERKDMLYGAFWLLALSSYIRYARTEGRGTRWYLLCLVCFAMSLMSKPMAISLPLVLFILDFFPLERCRGEYGSFRALVTEKTPFFAMALASGVVTLAAQWAWRSMEAMKFFSFAERIWIGQRAVGFYLAKTILPLNLVPLYPLETDFSPFRWDFLCSLATIILITLLALRFRRQAPVLMASWMYFLATLLPTLGIIQVGGQAAADRYMYLPILGPLVAGAALACSLWQRNRRGRAALISLVLFIAVALSILTVRQLAVWRDSTSLWEYVIGRKPGAVTAHYNLGNHFRDAGDITRATGSWKAVLEIQPDHSLALNQLGTVEFLSGSLRAAETYYRRAIAADGRNAEAHYNLGLTLERLGRMDESRRSFRRFLEEATEEYDRLVADVRRKVAAGTDP